MIIKILFYFIVSYFISKTISVPHKKIFIPIIALSQLLISVAVPFPIIFTTLDILLNIYIFNHSLTIEDCFHTFFYKELIIIAYLISQICLNSFMSVHEDQMTIILTIIIMIPLFIIKNKCKNDHLLFSSICFLLLFEMILILYSIVKQGPALLNICLLILSAIILFIILFFIKNRMNIKKAEEIALFNKQKLDAMKNIKLEMEESTHRLFYIVYQLEYYITHHLDKEALELIETYKHSILNYNIVIDTGNAIFDYLYSLKINQFIHKQIDVKNSILISKKNIYNDMTFIDFITDLLDFFFEVHQLYINIEEINNCILIKIMYRDGKVNEDQLKDYLKDKENIEYDLDDFKIKGVRIFLTPKGS